MKWFLNPVGGFTWNDIFGRLHWWVHLKQMASWTFLPATSPDEAEQKPKEIFGSPASAAALLWVGSGVWAGFQLSRWLFGLQQSVVLRKFSLLSLLHILISRVPSVCRAAASSVPGQPPGFQSRVYAGTGRPTPACLKYPSGEGHRALIMQWATHAVPKWQSSTPESEWLLFPSSDSYTESNYLVSIPVCCQKFMNFWFNLAKLLCNCISFDVWIVPLKRLLFLTSFKLPMR